MFVDFIIVLIKAGVVLFGLLNLAGLLTWAERKQSAIMQDRIGPNRANIPGVTAGGLFHIMADGIKMIAKEDFIPTGANRALHTLAPAATLFPALVVFAVIPFGDVLRIGAREILTRRTTAPIATVRICTPPQSLRLTPTRAN